MKVFGRIVDRYLRSAVDDMVEKNEKEILCPCRKCKEGVWLDPFKGGRLKAHLLRYGFMDGYTRWIIEDDDDDINGATNNPMAADEEMIDGSETKRALEMTAEKRPHMVMAEKIRPNMTEKMR